MIRAGSGWFGLPTIDEILATIGKTLSGTLSGVWDSLWSPVLDAWPLAWSIMLVVGVILACTTVTVLLRMYFPDSWTKWLRIFLGFIVFGMIPWLIGRWTMWREMIPKVDAARGKSKPPPPRPKPRSRPSDSW